jgi:hypothetical protein
MTKRTGRRRRGPSLLAPEFHDASVRRDPGVSLMFVSGGGKHSRVGRCLAFQASMDDRALRGARVTAPE